MRQGPDCASRLSNLPLFFITFSSKLIFNYIITKHAGIRNVSLYFISKSKTRVAFLGRIHKRFLESLLCCFTWHLTTKQNANELVKAIVSPKRNLHLHFTFTFATCRAGTRRASRVTFRGLVLELRDEWAPISHFIRNTSLPAVI